MSWNFSVNGVTKENADAALNAAAEGQIDNIMRGDSGEEMMAQAEQSTYAAVAIIESGCLGDGPFLVSLSGHANPGHEPRDGWVNDVVSISISAQRGSGG